MENENSGKLEIKEPLTSTIQFNACQPNTKMMVAFGTDPKVPMITVYHGDQQAVVQIWRDGTCKLNEQYLDEAARTFYKAVASVIQLDLKRPGFVVRKKGVSRFLQVRVDVLEWTQNPDHATRFADKESAELACASFTEEVVPAAEAMIFERFRSTV